MENTTPTSSTAPTFTKAIWVSMKPTFEHKVKHLNRLLAKQGKAPITFTYENYRTVQVPFTEHLKGDAFANDKTTMYPVEFCDAVCTGFTTVKKDDVPYTYIGTVSFEDDIKQIFCKDEAYLPYFNELFRPNFCDHCHTTRSNRKTYFLFATPDNRVLQIGSTCAKEYFGIDSIAFLEAFGNTFFVDYSGCEDDFRDFSRGCITFSFAEAVPLLDYATRGFSKWNKADSHADPFYTPIQDLPTVSAVRTLITESRMGERVPASYNFSKINLTLEDCQSYWKNRTANEASPSSFSLNVMATMNAGYATSKSLGPFLYAIFAAFNHKYRALQDAANAELSTAVPCPYPVSSRQNLTGIVTAIRSFRDTNYYDPYGYNITKYIVDFTDSNNSLYHFTTSAETFSSVGNGDKVSIRATIGETKPFKGIPYTRLSRPICTVIEKASHENSANVA